MTNLKPPLPPGFFFCALVFVLLCAASPLVAEEDPTTLQARQRWNEGVAAFQQGDYELARAAFAQVYALKPTPEVLRNLGEMEVASGHYVAGANHLTQFLRENEVSPEERTKILRSITKATAFVGRLEITSDVKGAQVFIDGRAVGSTPLDDLVYVQPGWRQVRLSKDARDVQRLIEASAGEALPLYLSFEEHPVAASDSTETTEEGGPATLGDTESSWKTPVVIVGGTLALVGLGVGSYFLVRASSLDDDATALRGRAGGADASSSCHGDREDPRCAELRNTVADGRRAERLAAGGFVAGGALALGTVLAWWLWPAAGETQRAAWTVSPLHDAAGTATWGGVLSTAF